MTPNTKQKLTQELASAFITLKEHFPVIASSRIYCWLGRACEMAKSRFLIDQDFIGALRDYLERETKEITGTFIVAEHAPRIFNVSSICFRGCSADAIMMRLENYSLSNGSACSSTSIEPSRVLLAMGFSENDIFSTIRFSLGRYKTKEQIDNLIRDLKISNKDFRLIHNS